MYKIIVLVFQACKKKDMIKLFIFSLLFFGLPFFIKAQTLFEKVKATYSYFEKIDNKFYKKSSKSVKKYSSNFIQRNAVAGCGYFCNTFVVPVTGMELEGKRINDENALLTWKTFSEYNNVGFNIERSFSGNEASFIKVGYKTGAGNSTSELQYSKTDQNNFNGISYYRLKQMDFDGKFTYSNIAKVTGYKNAAELKIYPNPGNSSNIVFFVAGLQNNMALSLQITDAAGRKVYAKNEVDLSNGRISLHKLVILLPGFYTAVFRQNTTFLKNSFVVTQ